MSNRRDTLARMVAVAGGLGLGGVVTRSWAQNDRQPRLALVLGGGSARGFAHIGVIKALESQGIRPDAIFGASAGALVGAFWAAGVSAAAMESLAYRVRDDEVIDLVSGQAGSRRGIVSGHALQAFVNQQLGQRPIESFPTPFRAVATRYPEGTLHIFKQGDAGFAVRASCSLPGVFLPAARGDEEYLDGGLISPMPVQAARAEGYDLIVAVDVGGADPGNRQDRGSGLFQVLLRSFEIMGEALRRQEGARADILVRPDVARISSTDFAARRVLVEAGFQAGQRLAPVIRQKLERMR